MANPAAFIVLLTYTCSAFLFLPRGQSWRSHAFSPVPKRQFHICKNPIIMAFTVNQEIGSHRGSALQQYSKCSPFFHSNIPQLLHYQHRNWYFYHNTTTKTPNLAREHTNNDQQEREEDICLPIASKDDTRLVGEEGGKEELGNAPQSISTPSRDVDKLLSPLPFIDGVG